jgi:ribonuclease E
LPVDVATFLLNEKREWIQRIEEGAGVQLLLVANPSLETPNYSIRRVRDDQTLMPENAGASFELSTPNADLTEVAAEMTSTAVTEVAAVERVAPSNPAPAPAPTPVAKAKSSGGLVGFFKRLLFGDDEPKKTSSQPRKNNRSEGRRGRNDQNRQKNSRGRQTERNRKPANKSSKRSNENRNQAEGSNRKRGQQRQGNNPKADEQNQDQDQKQAQNQAQNQTQNSGNNEAAPKPRKRRRRSSNRNRNQDSQGTDDQVKATNSTPEADGNVQARPAANQEPNKENPAPKAAPQAAAAAPQVAAAAPQAAAAAPSNDSQGQALPVAPVKPAKTEAKAANEPKKDNDRLLPWETSLPHKQDKPAKAWSSDSDTE